MTKDQIIQRLTQMTEAIDEAQNNVAAGIIKDLTHMDNEMAQVCDDIVKLPPEEAAQVQPVMADMISRLEALAQSLQSFKSQMK